MSTGFFLWSNSGDELQITPEYSATDDRVMMADKHRTAAGKLYSYKWATYRRWQLPVELVDSSFRFYINTWWLANEGLLFTADSFTSVRTVLIMNDDLPISKFIEPYDNLYRGVIILEETA